jgi:hypothetical protein
MTRGVCRVLIPGTLEGTFPFIVDLLKVEGVSLRNPASGKITSWTDDGEQIEVLEEKIFDQLVSGQVRNIQFWKTESKDMFVSWSEEPTGHLFSFYLDGLPVDVAVSLASKLAEIVLTTYRTGYGDEPAFVIKFE